MHTLGTHFGELLKNIEPPQDRLEAAKEIPGNLRQFLRETDDFPTLDPHSQLAGSYRRHTTIGDIKDVDIVVRVDASLKDNPGSVIHRLKGALDKLPDALGLHGYAEVRAARRSVHVYFEDRDFHLDVVPAIAPNGLDEILYVPDKSWGEWIPSHPIGYVHFLSELNEKHGGKVVPLIKLIKHFRDYQMKARKPKSYWLEALVVYHVVNGTVDMDQSLAEIFRGLLAAIQAKFAPILGRDDGATPHIPDPMLKNDISWNWDRSHFETFMRRVEEALGRATRALEADDQKDAVELWQKVFGEEKFPADAKERAHSLAAAAPGVAFIASSGHVTARRPESGLYTPSQPTKFYGGS